MKEVDTMPEWKLKSCPRCMGDTFLYEDIDGWYEQCLQCGYRRELKSIAKNTVIKATI